MSGEGDAPNSGPPPRLGVKAWDCLFGMTVSTIDSLRDQCIQLDRAQRQQQGQGQGQGSTSTAGGSTFWLDGCGDQDRDQVRDRCDLERLACLIYQLHVCSPESASESASTSTSDSLDAADCMGLEFWVQVRKCSGGGGDGGGGGGARTNTAANIGFHWDKCEKTRAARDVYVHPLLSTVTYLGSCGSPTVITGHRVGTDGAVKLGSADDDAVCTSFVEAGKHICFDGALLHGVPPPTSRQCTCGAACIGTRVTFMVNVWGRNAWETRAKVPILPLPVELRAALGGCFTTPAGGGGSRQAEIACLPPVPVRSDGDGGCRATPGAASCCIRIAQLSFELGADPATPLTVPGVHEWVCNEILYTARGREIATSLGTTPLFCAREAADAVCTAFEAAHAAKKNFAFFTKKHHARDAAGSGSSVTPSSTRSASCVAGITAVGLRGRVVLQVVVEFVLPPRAQLGRTVLTYTPSGGAGGAGDAGGRPDTHRRRDGRPGDTRASGGSKHASKLRRLEEPCPSRNNDTDGTPPCQPAPASQLRLKTTVEDLRLKL